MLSRPIQPITISFKKAVVYDNLVDFYGLHIYPSNGDGHMDLRFGQYEMPLCGILRPGIFLIEQQMRSLTGNDPVLSEKMRHVTTIPGVSFITAVRVIAETDGFANIGNRRQLVSYAGLDVVIKTSGTLTWRPHISKRGNAYIRAALYMSAVCSIIS